MQDTLVVIGVKTVVYFNRFLPVRTNLFLKLYELKLLKKSMVALEY